MRQITIKIVECDEPQYTEINGSYTTIFISGNRSKKEFYSILPKEKCTIKVIYSEALRKYWNNLPSILQVEYRKQVQRDIALMMSRNALLLAQGKADKDLIKIWSNIYEEHAWCL